MKGENNMKLNHIIIPNPAQKPNEELFADTMSTFMGEHNIMTWLDFKEKDTAFFTDLGDFVNYAFSQKKDYCKNYVDALYIEDNAGNIKEYFILTENNSIRHITV